MNLSDYPTISVIVPTFNEQEDILRTCEALVHLDYPNKETIIVDDRSTDNTVPVIEEYVRLHHFRLIQQPMNRGVASARNMGIQNAQGKVIVILNADVSPESDFLHRIASHYRDGAHYVTVESRVSNIEFFLPRYNQAFYETFHGGTQLLGWSEGFSCLRRCALEAGLFPEVFPGASGEDVVFFDRLSAICSNGVIDHSVFIPHVAPRRVRDFWSQFRGRGRGLVYYRHYFGNESLPKLALTRLLATAAMFVRIIVILPVLIFAIRLCHRSPKRYRDWLPFCSARVLQLVAHKYGEWKGLAELYEKKGHP